MSSDDEKKKSKWQVIKESLKSLPKIVKYGIVILLALALSSTGVMFSNIFKMQTQTTKFGLENVGELVTQTAHLTIVEDTKVHREFFKLFEIPFTESRQIFTYNIDVDASVDFNKISYYVKRSDKQIIIKIPHAKIYKTTLDIDSLKIYLDEESLFSRIDLKKHNEAMIEMKKQGEEDAIANGLLEAADENAKKLIEGFVKNDNNYRDYQIIYEYIGE